jgi:fructosamine-3-kinase
LGEVLIDITALEVNTMVVERITGDKFIAWEAYRDIYPISQDYLEQQEIHESYAIAILTYAKLWN